MYIIGEIEKINKEFHKKKLKKKKNEKKT